MRATDEGGRATLKNLVRALRLPFAAASLLPFVMGTLLARPSLSLVRFLLGICAVVSTHVSANAMNDYADSKSRADWQDTGYFGCFGGSKLIQTGVFSERSYLLLAVAFGAMSLGSVVALAVLLRSVFVVVMFCLILFLAWSYSARPLALSYRGVGEAVIFLLFGPAVVMGGYFLQTRLFPTLEGFMVSLPFGFLTTAILIANEIPDRAEDRESGKHNWAVAVGQRHGYLLYFVIAGCGYLSILLCISRGYFSMLGLCSLVAFPMTASATRLLKERFADKRELVRSSIQSIGAHTIAGSILIADALFRRMQSW
jgi:1,4-dihydroxy-2-naphthoate octaprenyltransferase